MLDRSSQNHSLLHFGLCCRTRHILLHYWFIRVRLLWQSNRVRCNWLWFLIRPNKKNSLFPVTRPTLFLLVDPYFILFLFLGLISWKEFVSFLRTLKFQGYSLGDNSYEGAQSNVNSRGVKIYTQNLNGPLPELCWSCILEPFCLFSDTLIATNLWWHASRDLGHVLTLDCLTMLLIELAATSQQLAVHELLVKGWLNFK